MNKICNNIEQAYIEAAEEVLGKRKKKKRPFMSELSWKLIDERACIHGQVIETRSERRKVHIKRTVQSKRQRS